MDFRDKWFEYCENCDMLTLHQDITPESSVSHGKCMKCGGISR